ncbi:MAG TPA: PEP-utilizing enzyme [Candidatus Limnocylindrales bacterium]|nr:PEP-utilizing enzyme [Candidatus Limnocylindrales bacterium]
MPTRDAADPSADQVPDPTAFPIAWESDRDPDLTWEWDDMHTPFPLAPLSEDYVRTLGAGLNAPYVTFGDFPQRWHCRVWNGYAYFGREPGIPPEAEPANRERWLAVMRDRVAVTEAYWRDEVLPEITALETEMRELPIETASPSELVVAWERAWAVTRRMWDLHFCIILGPYQVVEDLVDFYERHVPGRPAGESVRLTQGTPNEIVETERGMEHLAAVASANERLAAALVEAATGPVDGRRMLQPADLDRLPGGTELRAALEAFLVRHGHLGMNGEDLELVPWEEDPAAVLATLGARLAAPPEPSDARLARLVAEAEALAAGVRARLADQPDELAEFDRLYTFARTVGPITETHNYWIDRMAQARLRSVALRIADRLVAAGCFDDRTDILYLYRTEVRELIERPADRRTVIAARRAERVRQRALTPPPIVGVLPAPSTEPDRFSGDARPSEVADLLLGTGSSAGVVRGPARLALGPSDFGRIRSGDIIVCPASNPSWVPIFAIAAGLVTNTGGILSHAAVVAREFGLPAVTGVAGATAKIADGRLIEIDGTKGSVRLL